MSKLWLWKNFVDGRPEYLAFDNPYPCHPNGDPQTLGEPCGYAILKDSVNGRPEKTEAEVLSAIKRSQPLPPAGGITYRVIELHGQMEHPSSWRWRVDGVDYLTEEEARAALK